MKIHVNINGQWAIHRIKVNGRRKGDNRWVINIQTSHFVYGSGIAVDKLRFSDIIGEKVVTRHLMYSFHAAHLCCTLNIAIYWGLLRWSYDARLKWDAICRYYKTHSTISAVEILFFILHEEELKKLFIQQKIRTDTPQKISSWNLADAVTVLCLLRKESR